MSVVIPTYNAQATLDETLTSVRQQSHRNLEIIVVNDGSTDGSLGIARRHADLDSRVRIISIDNSGVAVARNTGVDAGSGPFVAPIDADDLWHPTKIARQLAVMEAGGPEMGFVFTLFRRIDHAGRVMENCADHPFEGEVFLRMLLFNFVSNGSSLLIRRQAFDEVGGYEPDLRRRGAQGCEDYLLQLLIARRWKVGRVPEYLTAYRSSPGTMSSDKEQMARSHLVMLEHLTRRCPETPASELAASAAVIHARNAVARFRRLRLAGGTTELWRALRHDARTAAEVALFTGARVVGGMVQRRIAGLARSGATTGPTFFDLDPKAGLEPSPLRPLGRQLAERAGREATFFALRGEANDVSRVDVVRHLATADSNGRPRKGREPFTSRPVASPRGQ